MVYLEKLALKLVRRDSRDHACPVCDLCTYEDLIAPEQRFYSQVYMFHTDRQTDCLQALLRASNLQPCGHKLVSINVRTLRHTCMKRSGVLVFLSPCLRYTESERETKLNSLVLCTVSLVWGGVGLMA